LAGGGKVVAIMNALPSPIAASLRSRGLGARLLRPLVNRLMPGGPTPIVVRSGPGKGLRLLIDPRSEKYYWTGTHETTVQEAVSTFLKPGMAFWDIGAHIGFFALIGSRLVGDSGHVQAFEPMPENFDRLTANIEGNALGNVEAHCVALSDEEGSAAFVTLGSSLKGHLTQGKDGAAEGVVRVDARTIDMIVSRAGRIP
jgi:FkbM family methyltransferase